MAYQYVREPLTQEDADRLANSCESVQEELVIWPLLDCGLRVSELCGLTLKQIQWQQRCLRIKGKGGPYGTKSKARVVPMSIRVRTIFEPYFALNDSFPFGVRQTQKVVKRIANRARLSETVTPHAAPHICDKFPAKRRLTGCSQEDSRTRPADDD